MKTTWRRLMLLMVAFLAVGDACYRDAYLAWRQRRSRFHPNQENLGPMSSRLIGEGKPSQYGRGTSLSKLR